MVEVAHEALLRQWPPLREAIEADRDLLRLRSELERLAADWQQGQRDDSYLLRGGRLAAIDQWASRAPRGARPARARVPGGQPSAGDPRAGGDPPVQPAAARAGRRPGAAAGRCAGGRRAGRERRARQAQAQTRLALSRQLAAEAERLVDTRPDMAILAGLQSLSLARDHARGAARPGSMTGLARSPIASRLLTGHTDAVSGVAFSPDGALLATASADGRCGCGTWPPASRTARR